MAMITASRTPEVPAETPASRKICGTHCMVMYAAVAWRPKKQAIAQEVRLLVMRRATGGGLPATGPVVSLPARRNGVQGRIATPASAAQTTSPVRQLPPSASVMGTVRAAASEVPRARAIE